MIFWLGSVLVQRKMEFGTVVVSGLRGRHRVGGSRHRTAKVCRVGANPEAREAGRSVDRPGFGLGIWVGVPVAPQQSRIGSARFGWRG